MAFAVVLASKCFAADCAYEGSFVGVSAEVGSQVVCASEPLWTQATLEGGWVFLDSFWLTRGCSGSLWVGKIQDVVPVLD